MRKNPSKGTATPPACQACLDAVAYLQGLATVDSEADLARESASETEKPRLRGFALLDSARRKEISKMGGTASQASGAGHRFTSEEARVAGSRGGRAPRNRRPKGEKASDGDGTPPPPIRF